MFILFATIERSFIDNLVQDRVIGDDDDDEML
jgi:hypothetical protein